MKSICVSIGKAKTRLGDLVKQAKSGTRVTITARGRSVAVLDSVPVLSFPWRVEKPDDPARYGDLQKPVMALV